MKLIALLLLGALAAPAEVVTLKQAFKKRFLVGAALNGAQFTESDARGATLVRTHFNSITPENVLKWEAVHPAPDKYAFELPDRYVAFGEKNGMFIVGHTLVWHSQTPKWVFENVDRDALLKRMREHIHTVVGRYKGRIKGWDVVNEALNEDGTLRQSPWLKIIGEDYIAKAFQYAHEADPAAELYYNDYNLENKEKREGAVRLLKQLKDQKVPIFGVGLQGHNNLEWPSLKEQDVTLAAFQNLKLKIMITELDIDVLPPASKYRREDIAKDPELRAKLNPYAAGLPNEVQQQLAKRYADLFCVYSKYSKAITRVTFWGVADGDSWKNNWPVRGRVNYPLLFDRDGQPKPAFESVVEVAAGRGCKM